MYKRINTDLLVYDDAFVEYDVPSSYNVGDYDQDLDDPEKEYWGDYSAEGKALRRGASYFIAGSSDDSYFIDQLLIRDNLRLDNESIEEIKKKQTPRFEFSGNTANMVDSFKGDPYAVYLDNPGALRLFVLSDGKLSVKRSSDYFSWEYDVQEQIIHKTYIDDKLNKERLKN